MVHKKKTAEVALKYNNGAGAKILFQPANGGAYFWLASQIFDVLPEGSNSRAGGDLRQGAQDGLPTHECVDPNQHLMSKKVPAV